MLRIDSTTTSYNASSIIGGNNVASFTANINNPGEGVYVSVGFNNLTTLQANLAELKEDLDEFIDTIAE